MRKSLLAAVAALTVSLPLAAAADPAASGQLIYGVGRMDQAPPLVEAQYAWGGRQYCWYWNGWHGSGWYWCGYAFRRGFGWGGAEGWRNWNHDWRGHDHERFEWERHHGHDHDRGNHRGWDRDHRDRGPY
ncbi:MAG: hypothetical protein ACREOE_13145 [Gemmatimonadales bacterium]